MGMATAALFSGGGGGTAKKSPTKDRASYDVH